MFPKALTTTCSTLMAGVPDVLRFVSLAEHLFAPLPGPKRNASLLLSPAFLQDGLRATLGIPGTPPWLRPFQHREAVWILLWTGQSHPYRKGGLPDESECPSRSRVSA